MFVNILSLLNNTNLIIIVMKFERLYPNYKDIFTYCGSSISIDRRCLDGVLRHINTIYFKTRRVCKAYFTWMNENE